MDGEMTKHRRSRRETSMNGSDKGAGLPSEAYSPDNADTGSDTGRHWVGAWSIAHTNLGQVPASFDNQTFRTVIRVNLEGAAVRLRLSNRYGRKPIQIGAAAVSHCNMEGCSERNGAGAFVRRTILAYP